MTTLKRIVVLYFASVIAYLIISKLFGGQVTYMLSTVGLWLAPVLAIITGQTIKFIRRVALEKQKATKNVYKSSYLIGFISFAVFVFFLRYNAWRHEKHFGNVEANESTVKAFSVEEKVAFDSLSKILVDANSFVLTGANVTRVDTFLDGHKQTIWFTTLQYTKDNQEHLLKAKFAVINGTAHLLYYDTPLGKDDFERIDSLERVVLKTFDAALKIAPDSIKNEIKNLAK